MKKIFFIVAVLLLPGAVSAATLSVSPSSQSVNAGDTFSVIVNLNTQNSLIDGVDLRYLNYNPTLLQIQDANASVSGVQITPGTLMSATLANTVDTNLGRITFSQVTGGGKKYTGSGTLATISFKALASGTANLTFSYTPNNTTDSNIAAAGADILNAVVNGSYTISGGSSVAGGGGSTTSGGGSSGGGGGGGTSTSGSSNTGAFFSSAGSSYSYTLSTNLSKGSKGNDVTELQKFLVANGYLTTDNVTGYFGPATEAAVQSFQRGAGIISSGSPLTTGYGFVGPTTRSKINQLLSAGGGSRVASNTIDPATLAALKAQILVLQQQVFQLLIKLQALLQAGR